MLRNVNAIDTTVIPPGFSIDERDERRCSDQTAHAHRQSDWTGYAQQSATCSGFDAIAASDARAEDVERRADDVVDYARHTGQPPRPASGQSQRYDGHPLRRTSTERQQWMSYVADEVPPPHRHDCDRLEPLRPSEQNLTFRENVMVTATQTESTEPSYLKKVAKRLDFMTSDRVKSRPTAKASYACTPAMHRPTINVKQRKSTPNVDVRTAYDVPSKCKASGDNYGDITNTCHYAHRNVDCVDERELRSQSANGMSVCYEKRLMERADSESSTRRASRRASSRGVHRPSSRDSDVDERQASPGRHRGSMSSRSQHDTAERKATTGCVKHAVPSKHVSTDKDCTDTAYAPGNKGKYKSTSGRRRRGRSGSSSSDSSQSSSEKQRPSSDGRRSRQRHRSSSSSSDSCNRHHRTHRRSSSSADSRKRFQHQIRADRYDGRGCVDTFLAKFESCAEYNGWNSRDKAAHLKSALTGNAATLLQGNAKATYAEVIVLLQRRYGNSQQHEKFKLELKSRRRKPDEDIQSRTRNRKIGLPCLSTRTHRSARDLEP